MRNRSRKGKEKKIEGGGGALPPTRAPRRLQEGGKGGDEGDHDRGGDMADDAREIEENWGKKVLIGNSGMRW